MIDSHVHVWAMDPERYPWQPLLSSVPIPQAAASVEDLARCMDESGVERAVLVQSSLYGWDNRYLCDARERDSRRFAAVCLVNVHSAQAADDLRYWCGERGCAGMRINLLEEHELGFLVRPEMAPLWSMAESLSASVSVQLLPSQAGTVRALAHSLPRLRFVIDYMGPSAPHDGSGAAALRELGREPNVFCKLLVVAQDSTCPFPFEDLWDYYATANTVFAPNRLVFGTDYPYVTSGCSYGEGVRLLSELPFVDPARLLDAVEDTAIRLWRFE